MTRASIFLLLLALPLVACPTAGDDDDAANDDDSTEEVDFRLWGPDFLTDEGIAHNYPCEQALPPENSCGNPNPELLWEGAPEGTVSFVLIFDDVSFNDYAHWALLNIPGDATGLDADISGIGSGGDIPDGSTELDNGSNFNGYLGSCPTNVNHYRWRLWALDTELDEGDYTGLAPAATAYAALAADAEAASIERVEMCHVFDGDDAQR